MAIPLVQVRHKTTGAKTFLPETALPNFPDYVKTPSQKSRDQVPDGTAFPGGGDTGQESTDGYEAMTVGDLKAEIERRNSDRDEADQLPTVGKKAELIATLESDDVSRHTNE